MEYLFLSCLQRVSFPEMATRLLVFLLLCLHPGVTQSGILDLVDDIVQDSDLRCVLVVLDHPDSLGTIRRDVFRKLGVQLKVIFKNDIKQMENLGSMSKCGVFVKFERDDLVSKYLDTVLELNSFDENIFKTLHWYIFLDREKSMDQVFRYNSNVYLVLGEGGQVTRLVETYSVEEGVQVNKIVGKWLPDIGLGGY